MEFGEKIPAGWKQLESAEAPADSDTPMSEGPVQILAVQVLSVRLLSDIRSTNSCRLECGFKMRVGISEDPPRNSAGAIADWSEGSITNCRQTPYSGLGFNPSPGVGTIPQP